MRGGAVFVAGATGYVGGRLVPLLLSRGYAVRAGVRSPRKLAARPWSSHPSLTALPADVADKASLVAAMRGCAAAYYLVHSMGAGGDFAQADRAAARNMAEAAAEAGVSRIIYLSGLGDDAPGLSEHLRSRSEVGRILSEGPVPATVLRAAVILGSGSASFEIIRNLVERLPLMITPRWVRTRCQPIAVSNVLGYLVGCLENPATSGLTLDIGGPDVLTYAELFRTYARAAHIRAPLIIPVPFLTTALSASWVNLITPVPAHLIQPLIEGLKNEVVCHDKRILDLVPQQLLSCRDAIAQALSEVSQGPAPSCCFDAGQACAPSFLAERAGCPAEWTKAGDAPFAGGALFTADYAVTLDAAPAQVWEAVTRIGGDTGWYAGDLLWRVRGLVDKLVGGPGHMRGRRDPVRLGPGDALDFWRVLDAAPEQRLLLLAEMKVPGAATLELRLEPADQGTRLSLLTSFHPRGLLGLVYWWSMYPAHGLLFPAMLRNVARAAHARVTVGPVKLAPKAARP
ncbi:MAG: SDR family oxidoreductase [Humidesulfovibrio sp.]|nr:SDR family oxidoreductase [Humidesulfovibrio sp.]